MALSYNGIDLSYPKTETNRNSPGLDPSNSDQLFTSITIKAQAVINLDLAPALVADGDAGGTLARIRHMLTQPRMKMYYDLTSPTGQTGPNPIINLPSGRDDAGGPMPDPDAFSAVYTTPSTILVSWSCTVKLRDCGVQISAPISLRWQDTIEFNNKWKATYRRVGVMIVSSLDSTSVDRYRASSVAPLVPPGFARESASYTISKDGLRCDFSFVDGQVRWVPPYPCVDLDITQQENAPSLGGVAKGEIHVRVGGVISANPADMYYWSVVAAMTRLNASRPLGNGPKFIGATVFRLMERKDAVDAEFSVSYKATTTATSGARVRIPGVIRPVVLPPWVGFGTTPRSQFNQYPGPGPQAGYAQFADPVGSLSPGPADGKGTATAISLFAALLQDPCGSRLKVQPNAGV